MMNLFSTKIRPVSAVALSHVGKKRINNEDNLYFNGQFLTSDNRGTLEIMTYSPGSRSLFATDCFFAIFDGMGGGDYGEIASYTAAVQATHYFWDKDIPDFPDRHDISISLRDFSIQTSKVIYQKSMELKAHMMGTTIAGLYFFDGRAWVCNVGDSRCYRLRDGVLKVLSEDHTDEDFMRMHGITGRKPYLTQYLGANPQELAIEPYVKSHHLEAGDLFLLCSDGLTDMVPNQEIRNILSSSSDLKSVISLLQQAALNAGGKDNITIILCQC